MKVAERVFGSKGRRIAARCWHDESLPPLLALHGYAPMAFAGSRQPQLQPAHLPLPQLQLHAAGERVGQGERFSMGAAVAAQGWLAPGQARALLLGQKLLLQGVVFCM